ncbi:hypothetical protein CFP56_011813 [Quercus suber]|uniref:Uncharacterized protein n=1 Tax=Quercus suber TaxID=58331 RepID=A0AAW0KYC3_QUESU
MKPRGPSLRTDSFLVIRAISGLWITPQAALMDFIPTSQRMISSAGLLWMVMGVSNLHGFLITLLWPKRSLGSTDDEPMSWNIMRFLVEINCLRSGRKVSVEEKVFLAAAEAVKTAMSNLLVKKQYSAEK